MDLFRCDDCGKRMPAEAMADPKHLSQRVDPGGIMPAGECPECGALCYPVDQELDRERAITDSLAELAKIRDRLTENKIRAPKFLEAIRHAIRSGGGALRNARNQEARKSYGARKDGE